MVFFSSPFPAHPINFVNKKYWWWWISSYAIKKSFNHPVFLNLTLQSTLINYVYTFTYFSVCPTYLESMSLEVTLYNGYFVSAAIACTSIVFPVPGGPNKRNVLHIIWSLYSCGWSCGSINNDFSNFLIACKPAMSSNPLLFGTTFVFSVMLSISVAASLCVTDASLANFRKELLKSLDLAVPSWIDGVLLYGVKWKLFFFSFINPICFISWFFNLINISCSKTKSQFNGLSSYGWSLCYK